MSEHDPWKSMRRDCRFELERDARRVEGSTDERHEVLFAVEPQEPLNAKLDCIRAAAREGLLADETMEKLGKPDAELVQGLLLVGSPGALREAKRRLGAGRSRATVPKPALVRIRRSGGEVSSFDLDVSGDALMLKIHTQATYAGDVDEGAIRKRFSELGGESEASAQGAEGELDRALREAKIAVNGQSALVTIELRSVPGLAKVVPGKLERFMRGSKIAQCNRLVQVINSEQGPLKSASGSDPDSLRKLADTLDHVATRVAAVEMRDAKLTGFRDDYAEMARDLAGASRETAAALDTNDPKRAANAARNMSSYGPRESELVDNINKYCSGGP
jgi:hypothetical protein